MNYRFDHRDSLVKLLNNPNVEKWLLSVPSPYTYQDADYFIASSICDISNPDARKFAIQTGGVHIGGIGLRIKQKYYAEVGYWIGEEYWNCGYGSEALKQIEKIAFEELSLGRLCAIVLKGTMHPKRYC